MLSPYISNTTASLFRTRLVSSLEHFVSAPTRHKDHLYPVSAQQTYENMSYFVISIDANNYLDPIQFDELCVRPNSMSVADAAVSPTFRMFTEDRVGGNRDTQATDHNPKPFRSENHQPTHQDQTNVQRLCPFPPFHDIGVIRYSESHARTQTIPHHQHQHIELRRFYYAVACPGA